MRNSFTPWRVATVLTLALLIGSAEAGSSMRCGQRLVGEQDLAAELLSACGAPSYRDQLLLQAPGGAYVADTEIWTYDFGPQQLIRLVTLRNGQISTIDTDGYGFAASASARCEPQRIVDGLSKYRLIKQCGEPLTRRSESALKPLFARPQIYRNGSNPYVYRNQYVTSVYREEWVYNFGARSAMRRVILEDGRVSSVENIDRGFDR